MNPEETNSYSKTISKETEKPKSGTSSELANK